MFYILLTKKIIKRVPHKIQSNGVESKIRIRMIRIRQMVRFQTKQTCISQCCGARAACWSRPESSLSGLSPCHVFGLAPAPDLVLAPHF